MSYKRQIPVLIGSTIIAILLISYPLDVPILNNIENEIISWMTIIASFALVNAFFNIAITTYRRFNRAKTIRNRIPVANLFVVCILLTIMGLVGSPTGSLYLFWYNALKFPLHMTMNGFIVFFLFSAAYRAMHMKNFESTIFTICCLLVTIGAAPIGEAIWTGFPVISSWLLDYPNAGTYRALTMTLGMGIFVFGARVLFMKEKRTYGLSGEGAE